MAADEMATTFMIDRSTGTLADELLAAGFITLLQWLYHWQGVEDPAITQIDEGHSYRLQCAPPLDMARVRAETRPFYPAPVIRTLKNAAGLPPDLPPAALVDYEQQKEQRAQYFEARKNLDQTALQALRRGEEHPALQSMPPAPHPHWAIFRLINPGALIGYNNMMLQWTELGAAGQSGTAAALLCDLFATSPNDVEAARAAWRELAKAHDWKLVDITAGQFFNPVQGKGVNRAQPDGVGLGNMSGFWLPEWLKAVGVYRAGITNTLQGVKDRKTYVPVYGRMTAGFATAVAADFRRKMFSETAVRSDILTVIRYMQAFLSRSVFNQAESAEERRQRELFGDAFTPADFMHGFQVAFYKDMGNSVTIMNTSFLNLPGWVIIRSEEDLPAYQEILQEHEGIVRQFAENKGADLDLLLKYRDFIVADHLHPFLEFSTAYSSWLISEGEKGTFPPRKFTTHNLRRLFVSIQPTLSDILDAQSFQNIAYAIRQSTVTAQYRKSQNDRRYDVRYGLGRDLVRRAQYPDEFLAALSDFLHKYNAENAQVMETRPGPYRKSIHTSDIQGIVQLVDEYGSELIAQLLVAYGYARESRAADEPAQQAADDLPELFDEEAEDND